MAPHYYVKYGSARSFEPLFLPSSEFWNAAAAQVRKGLLSDVLRRTTRLFFLVNKYIRGESLRGFQIHYHQKLSESWKQVWLRLNLVIKLLFLQIENSLNQKSIIRFFASRNQQENCLTLTYHAQFRNYGNLLSHFHSAINFWKTFHGPDFEKLGTSCWGLRLVSFES